MAPLISLSAGIGVFFLNAQNMTAANHGMGMLIFISSGKWQVFYITQKQKVKDFESDPTGKTTMDEENEFIVDDNINALSISMTEGRIVLLYEEL
jgi:hypothetical protein